MTTYAHPHLKSLSAKHQTIEKNLQDEENRPQPDTLHVSQLKREKLRIKDAMTSFERSHTTTI